MDRPQLDYEITYTSNARQTVKASHVKLSDDGRWMDFTKDERIGGELYKDILVYRVMATAVREVSLKQA